MKNPSYMSVYIQFNLPKFFTCIYYMYIIIVFHVVSKYLLVSVMIKVKVITTFISIIGGNMIRVSNGYTLSSFNF